MAASTSQLFFMVFLFWGGCLVLQPCQADHPEHCTLAKVKECAATRTPPNLANLFPIPECPSTELPCLENLDNCPEVDDLISSFRYLCDNDTGVLDYKAIADCFDADASKGANFTQSVVSCVKQSGWDDSKPTAERCTAAKTYGTCVKTAALQLCDSERAMMFYDKTKELFERYGCFSLEDKKKGEGTMMMPNLGMMAAVLGMTLMTLLFK